MICIQFFYHLITITESTLLYNNVNWRGLSWSYICLFQQHMWKWTIFNIQMLSKADVAWCAPPFMPSAKSNQEIITCPIPLRISLKLKKHTVKHTVCSNDISSRSMWEHDTKSAAAKQGGSVMKPRVMKPRALPSKKHTKTPHSNVSQAHSILQFRVNNTFTVTLHYSILLY